jgi:hypothetical protein
MLPDDAGRYFAAWGPLEEPITFGGEIPRLEVYDARADGTPIGVAVPRGFVRSRNVAVTVFRLVVQSTERPGLWVCVGRRFVPLANVLI